MTLSDLDALLTELRAFGTDHATIEAKRAKAGLPETTHETLSAFANAEGGCLLLGVDEAGGTFPVTGVDDPRQVLSDLQSLCSLMEPPLRPQLDLLAHPDGAVVSAWIAPVPRDRRPCHRRPDGPTTSSFVRVGDADQRLTPTEVAALLTSTSGHDHSSAPAPPEGEIDDAASAEFVARLRSESPRYRDVPADTLLHQWGATTSNGRPTLAGLLHLGTAPQRHSAAARVTYRRLPRPGDPAGTRFSGRHLEGTVGELLDDVLDAVRADLTTVQVVDGGAVRDDTDVPLEALRELLSNALVHRSLAPTERDSSVLVEVDQDAVTIVSPGCLHGSADTSSLGLASIAGVRNLCLVRLGERLRTPSGARIVEHQTSGIAAADRACHRRGTAPALFLDRAASFQATLLRGPLPTAGAHNLLSSTRASVSEDGRRLVALALRLRRLRESIAGSALPATILDAHLAARALAPSTVEDAAVELRALEDAGVLRRSRIRRYPAWELVSGESEVPQPRSRGRASRVPDVVAALRGAPQATLTAKQIGEALGLTSPTSRNRWLRRAEDDGLIEYTGDNPFDPTGAYRLTAKGRLYRARGT
ncbi:MAG: putative DNA binding domain-containing protein [Kineosporiaceae bacterium]